MKMHTQIIDGPEIIAWVGAIVTIVLHYTGSTALPPEALGAALTAVIYPLVMSILRLVSKKSDGGNSPTLISILFLAAFAFVFSGCAHHKCAGDLSVSIKPNAPAHIGAKCGSEKDERVSVDASGAATLKVKCPEGKKIGAKPGTSNVLWCVGSEGQ